MSKGPFTPKGYYAIAIGWTISWLMFCTLLGGYIYTENYFNYCNYHQAKEWAFFLNSLCSFEAL